MGLLLVGGVAIIYNSQQLLRAEQMLPAPHEWRAS